MELGKENGTKFQDIEFKMRAESYFKVSVSSDAYIWSTAHGALYRTTGEQINEIITTVGRNEFRK